MSWVEHLYSPIHVFRCERFSTTLKKDSLFKRSSMIFHP